MMIKIIIKFQQRDLLSLVLEKRPLIFGQHKIYDGKCNKICTCKSKEHP